MKPLALLVVGLLPYATFAQQYKPELQLDSLILKLHSVIAVQKDIETEEIKGVYKLSPWHFAPALNYDFINNNYYVTVSTAPFVSNMLGKRQETRRLSAIERRYENQIKSSEIKLKNTYLTLVHKLTNLQLSHEILLNDIEIFKIKQQQHTNNEIDTEAFLKERSSILNKIKNHNSEVSDIHRFLSEIELLTEHEIEMDVIRFFVSPASLTSHLGEVREASNQGNHINPKNQGQ